MGKSRSKQDSKTIDAIYQIVVEKTKEYCEYGVFNCTANLIGENLYISRSLSSLYLNNLVKERKIIKIISRPVYFLDRVIIENSFSIRIKQDIFEDIDEFTAMIHDKGGKKNDFLKIIGHNTSLRYCVNQCIMALNYPPNGLPILLVGEKGTGKKLMAKCMYEYAISNNIISNDSKFVVYHCSKDRKNDVYALFHQMIKSKEEHLQNIVYISNIENMNSSDLTDIINILQTRYLDGNLKKQTLDRIILSTTTSLENISKELVDMIPVHVQIPDLENRFLADKRELLIHFLKREEQKFHTSIKLNKLSFTTMLNYHYPENIAQMENVVKWTCANAVTTANESNIILIKPLCLPGYIIQNLSIKSNLMEENENTYSGIDEFRDNLPENRSYFYTDNLILSYERYMNAKLTFNEFIYSVSNETNSYFDYLMYEMRYSNNELKALEAIILRVVNNISENYNIYLSANFSIVLSRILYSLTISDERFENFKQRSLIIDEIYTLFCQHFADEMVIANEIKRTVIQLLDITIDTVNMIFICIYISFYNKELHLNNIVGVILSHGYSTASSIADAVNRMVGKHVFEAIDMPLDTPIDSIADTLRKYVLHKRLSNNILLLVDMGSLEDIGNSLSEISNLNIGVFNNISTKIALSAATKIIQNKNLKTILDELCEDTIISYKIIKNRAKRNAIVFSTENGIESAKRVIDLFIKSIPKEMDIDFLYYNFDNLDSESSDLLNDYEILLFIGSINPMLPNIPFVALEDIIANENISLINSILSNYLDNNGLTQFNKNLLKNFALGNILGYLTILNPEKLLNTVEIGVNRLQRYLGIEFSSKLVIGLDIHISCLIERLITKTDVEKEEQELTDKQLEFMHIFKVSFDELQSQYKVEIPKNEIIYIYRYIQEEFRCI